MNIALLQEYEFSTTSRTFEALGAYNRLPEPLQPQLPKIADHEKPDEFGCMDRLGAILQNQSLGNIIDLGGNSGYLGLRRQLLTQSRTSWTTTKSTPAPGGVVARAFRE
jgi:hypothetical protein